MVMIEVLKGRERKLAKKSLRLQSHSCSRSTSACCGVMGGAQE